MDRDSLAGFLRRHRDSLQPADVGLSEGSRRRTRGLRREEVAQLAAMSTDYSTRLEQHRGARLPVRAQVASLRAALGMMGKDSRAGALVRELIRVSAEFASLWEAQEVSRRFEDHKVLIHPEIGEIEVDCQALFTEDESQVLLILTAPPRSEDADKLDLLAALGTQQFGTNR
ncbi:MmyB family transcriptional regulator [Acidipropionibacterium jensenii]|uniref:MmyB family transcriptional regulator n=1 Tax=Acidipropionibacterium jensenii TaxID=1749 RepID=UPI00214BB14F|nr:hypothetical protein [Acidipropionibacterium jensenii]